MRLSVKYECGACYEVHDTEWSAQECCPVSIAEVFECPECGDVYNKEAEALDCCPAPDPADYKPSPAELEAQGQMRLELQP